MSENTNDSANPILTFEGKKYLINELSNEIKESIKVLQIAICNTFIDSFISLESSFIKYFLPSKVKIGFAESFVFSLIELIF